jgi:hypothetical protein
MKIYTYKGEKPLVVKRDEIVLLQEGCGIRRHGEKSHEPGSLPDGAVVITARQFWEACDAVKIKFRKIDGGYQDVPLTTAYLLPGTDQRHPTSPMMKLAFELGLEKSLEADE